MPEAAYQRVILKLSGESLAGPDGRGIDFTAARGLARDLAALRGLGTEIALVLGGGNLMRGRQALDTGVPRQQADRVGMLGTVMNALSLAALLAAEGAEALVLTATPMLAYAETFAADRARAALAAGAFVIAAGGIGHPFFSTDTTAALRGIELEVDCLLKATTVDGVYSSDPRQDSNAEKLSTLGYDEVLERRLAVMDATAFALCRDHGLPIRVFNFAEPGALERVLRGEALGSLVS